MKRTRKPKKARPTKSEVERAVALGKLFQQHPDMEMIIRAKRLLKRLEAQAFRRMLQLRQQFIDSPEGSGPEWDRLNALRHAINAANLYRDALVRVEKAGESAGEWNTREVAS